jgi:hypothetical protein
VLIQVLGSANSGPRGANSDPRGTDLGPRGAHSPRNVARFSYGGGKVLEQALSWS